MQRLTMMMNKSVNPRIVNSFSLCCRVETKFYTHVLHTNTTHRSLAQLTIWFTEQMRRFSHWLYVLTHNSHCTHCTNSQCIRYIQLEKKKKNRFKEVLSFFFCLLPSVWNIRNHLLLLFVCRIKRQNFTENFEVVDFASTSIDETNS